MAKTITLLSVVTLLVATRTLIGYGIRLGRTENVFYWRMDVQDL